MREYTQEELKEKLKTAYNVEARAGHKKRPPVNQTDRNRETRQQAI